MMKALAAILLTVTAAAATPSADVVIAVGAPGTDAYQKTFADAATAWEKAGADGGAKVNTVGDRDALKTAVTSEADTSTPLWIALIGHGTHDGREAKFNLPGPDVTDRELAGWLKEVKRPIAIINCSASSAPFIKTLSAENRIVITATKSAAEDSFARFGQYIAAAINDPKADIDGDGGTSLLEAFLKSSEDVAEFYEKEGRIATEQALIDDNGDGFGTPASWFRGTRAVKTAKGGATPDGNQAHQLHLSPSEEERRLPAGVKAQRDTLEAELFALRAKKAKMDDAEYYAELERIAKALAELYRGAEAPAADDA